MLMVPCPPLARPPTPHHSEDVVCMCISYSFLCLHTVTIDLQQEPQVEIQGDSPGLTW